MQGAKGCSAVESLTQGLELRCGILLCSSTASRSCLFLRQPSVYPPLSWNISSYLLSNLLGPLALAKLGQLCQWRNWIHPLQLVHLHLNKMVQACITAHLQASQASARVVQSLDCAVNELCINKWYPMLNCWSTLSSPKRRVEIVVYSGEIYAQEQRDFKSIKINTLTVHT